MSSKAALHITVLRTPYPFRNPLWKQSVSLYHHAACTTIFRKSRPTLPGLTRLFPRHIGLPNLSTELRKHG